MSYVDFIFIHLLMSFEHDDLGKGEAAVASTQLASAAAAGLLLLLLPMPGTRPVFVLPSKA